MVFSGTPEPASTEKKWFIWLIRAGRGSGKTRTGSEFVIDRVKKGFKRIALIGQTVADVRDTMVEVEESSIMRICPPSLKPRYEPSKRRLSFATGATATTFSGDSPDQLRGPQFDTGWIDELAKFKYPRETWNNLMFSLRLSNDPRCVVTTTPRPLPLLKELMGRKDLVDTNYSTFDNLDNLSEVYINNLRETYDGTRLGAQEIYGKILEDNPAALWTSDNIETYRVKEAPELKRVVVGVDPGGSSKKSGNETGIITAGISFNKHFYIVSDQSVKTTPNEWARRVVAAYKQFEADRVIGEQNFGGEMVENTVRTVDPNISYKSIHASRSKQVRAEPISALYEQGKVHHCGYFSELETEMVDWNPLESTYSPNRIDALVWCLSELAGESTRDFGDIDLSANVALRRANPHLLGWGLSDIL